VGFPIRKSADQSLFAAPHGLSQRTTSFIASQRQGIHRIPLRHLIALIVDARLGLWSDPQPQGFGHRSERPANFLDTFVMTTASMRLRPIWIDTKGTDARSGTTIASPLHDLKTTREGCKEASSRIPLEQAPAASFVWWSQTGSNRRPPACKAGALPAELWPQKSKATGARSIKTAGGPGTTRTSDLTLIRGAL
jgi:hypothetical protein